MKNVEGKKVCERKKKRVAVSARGDRGTEQKKKKFALRVDLSDTYEIRREEE